ncbi:MAG: energy transducer TonB [Ignavibacteriales bacterium]|nr:MAG: energy transducer TonB [Ignavibacteriales bacterium]
MITSAGKYNYNRNLAISFVISIVIVISIFLFTPEPSAKKIVVKTTTDNFIPVEYIPVTHQSLSGEKLSSQVSENNPPEIAVESIEPELADETETALTDIETASLIGDNGNEENVNEETQPGYNFSARQILEVIPGKKEKINGSIKLSLLVNKDGLVKEHKIVSSSLDCGDCLENILDAVYKSKWQPLVIKGKKTEFWTDKQYVFN